jgi:hypothetical protein
MLYALWEIVIPLIIALFVGVLVGWLIWGWRRRQAAETGQATNRRVLGDLRPYGDGSHGPFTDRSMPEGHPIKGNIDSMHYHRPDSRNYGATTADVWFDTAERAESSRFKLSPTHPQAKIASASIVGEQHPYGHGSHGSLSDCSGPEGYPIKGNVDSMLYHRQDSRNYDGSIAEVWFDNAERAEAAGFSLSPTHPKKKG